MILPVTLFQTTLRKSLFSAIEKVCSHLRADEPELSHELLLAMRDYDSIMNTPTDFVPGNNPPEIQGYDDTQHESSKERLFKALDIANRIIFNRNLKIDEDEAFIMARTIKWLAEYFYISQAEIAERLKNSEKS